MDSFEDVVFVLNPETFWKQKGLRRTTERDIAQQHPRLSD
jgi:hypothetical protein